MLFDTHAHLDDGKYDLDREEMLQRAQEKGVKLILNVGYDLPSSQRSVKLASEYDFVYAAVGIHPHDAKSANSMVWDELEELTKNPKVVALGEMGLDYYWDNSPRDVQKEVFLQQIGLAKRLKKPIIIHDRDAHGDVMEILRAEQDGSLEGVLHCFSGSLEMAKECIKLGFHISIAGPVTFNNANKLVQVAQEVPLDRLLIETDAPYLTPTPFRGKRNESAYVAYVAAKIAELRQMDTQEIDHQTYENGCRLFRIPSSK